MSIIPHFHTYIFIGLLHQHNQASSQLDLSQLYSPGDMSVTSLHSYATGEMLTAQPYNAADGPSEQLMDAPRSANLCMHSESALQDDANYACYVSGDSRCNANPLVTPLYTLLLRSHNSLVRSMRRRKGHWPGERVYRRARHINTAVYKRIVYNEWLPIVVGTETAAKINSAGTAESSVQGRTHAGSVSNEWATAAARFYYSMMPGVLQLNDVDDAWTTNAITAREELSGAVQATVLDMQQEWYRPRNLSHDNMLDRVLAATLKQRAQAMDSFYVNDVSGVESMSFPFFITLTVLFLVENRSANICSAIRRIPKSARMPLLWIFNAAVITASPATPRTWSSAQGNRASAIGRICERSCWRRISGDCVKSTSMSNKSI